MTNLNINFKKMLKETKFNAARIIIVGFLCVIIVGTLMLMLPVSSAKGQWTDFVTALFTATTSTCVTGLVVVPTYAYWSLFGKVVILILIQLGGLGIISIATGVLIIIGKKINLKERRLIQETYNLDTSQGVVLHIIRIFSGTLQWKALEQYFTDLDLFQNTEWLKACGILCFMQFQLFAMQESTFLETTALWRTREMC